MFKSHNKKDTDCVTCAGIVNGDCEIFKMNEGSPDRLNFCTRFNFD